MENSCGTENNTAKSCKLDSRMPILHPVIIGAPETSISVDTETTSLSGSDSDSESDCANKVLSIGDKNNVLGPVSTINVGESCSDFVIGPMTQFHGPVTIYQTVTSNTQNHNGIENNKPTPEGVGNASKVQLQDKWMSDDILTRSEHNVQQNRCRKIPVWFVLVFITITATVGIVIFLKTNSSKENKSNTTTEQPSSTESPDSEEKTTPAPGNFPHHMYTRTEWGGTPPTHLVNSLKHPTKYVIISHTAGSFCNDYRSCSEQVRNIQAYHIQELNSSDIGYNFLIGNDGAIYIGRGWDIRNIHSDFNIGISIMGNFVSRDVMTPKMVEILKDLLDLGVASEKLATHYKLVCHYQTYPTASPGKNVCDKVAQFPNYVPGDVIIKDD